VAKHEWLATTAAGKSTQRGARLFDEVNAPEQKNIGASEKTRMATPLYYFFNIPI
jgi:hypothetical protein